ncbi:MAG: hypothetical protein V8R90_07325 [Eubacterium sp.]
MELSEREQHRIIASIEQKKELWHVFRKKKKDLSARDAKGWRNWQGKMREKRIFIRRFCHIPRELEKYNSMLEQIHKQSLENQLKSKGIDNWETMDVLHR